jgi:hypothetical protein
METINIGVANLVLSHLLEESYFKGDFLSESKDFTSEFIDLVKNSPILQLEFKVFDNLEKKHIDNDVLATRYIDNNIRLFEVYTLEEISEENKKMEKFLKLDAINEYASNLKNDKINLYSAIGNLITESLKPSDEVEVDMMHESFNVVLDHIKEVKISDEEQFEDPINESILEIAVNKYNEKYTPILSEGDRELIKLLINSTPEEKKELFEEYKRENIKLLNSLEEAKYSDKVQKTIKKIDEMSFDKEKIDDSIIDLHELKQGLV